MYSAVQHMFTKLGYRFVLTRARFPTSVGRGASIDLTLSWTDKGNAPMYFDRRLLVRTGSRIFETAISMKGFSSRHAHGRRNDCHARSGRWRAPRADRSRRSREPRSGH
jgi:hypothetical protein